MATDARRRHESGEAVDELQRRQAPWAGAVLAGLGALVAGADGRPEALSRLRPPERDWSSERVLTVRLRIPTGAEQLERVGLSAEARRRLPCAHRSGLARHTERHGSLIASS